MKKQDLLTREDFYPKRSTQRFARPENRIRYHNRKAKELRNSLAPFDRPLHNNLRILNELMSGKAERTLAKQFLLGKGFVFGVFNHYVNVQDTRQAAIYNYTLIPCANDQIKIIRND